MRRNGTWLSVVVLMVLGSPASLQAFPFDLSAGIKGGATMSGAPEVPEDSTYRVNGSQRQIDPQYFGLIGVGGGVGVSIDARVDNTVGMETGLQFSADNALGTNDINSPSGEELATWTQRQRTQAFHVPLLIKGSIPLDKVRPYLGLGFEFIFQSKSSLEYSGEETRQTDRNLDEINEHNTIETSNYTAFQGTIGMEIDAGPMRIVPFEVRVGYNLAWDESFDKRIDVSNAGQNDERFTYDGQYLGHVSLYTGVYYRWDIDV